MIGIEDEQRLVRYDFDTGTREVIFDYPWFMLAHPLIALPAVAYAGQPFYRSAWQALKARRLNMDVPITLAIVLMAGIREELEQLAKEVEQLLGAVDEDALGVYESGLRARAAERLEDFELAAYRLPLTVDSGFHIDFARLPAEVPLRTTADYERMARMHTVACCEPSFWAGYDRGSVDGFRDYFRQLTEYEPKRAAAVAAIV